MVLPRESPLTIYITVFTTQRIDDPHESAGEVVSDVEHGALLPGVDESVAAHSHSQQYHGSRWMVSSEGGP